MSGESSIIKFLSTLTKSEQERVYNYLEKELILGSMANEIQDEIKENRFSSGRVCPYCKKDKVLRNGKYNKKQRYICKEVIRLLQISHTPLVIIVKKILQHGYLTSSV
ncbi:hypothetical protein GCM10008914_03910 [Clostridium tertium]|nr:hypothetical protein [Clostridium tertium]